MIVNIKKSDHLNEEGYSFLNTLNIDVQTLGEYTDLKKGLMMELIPAEANENLLKVVPHRVVEDLAMVYRFDYRDPRGDTIGIPVTNEMLKCFDVTEDELHADALTYAPVSHPAKLKTIQEMLPDLMGAEPIFFFSTPTTILVATTKDGYKGAAVIFYPGFLQKAVERFGRSCFVLPSSRHEMLIVPDDGMFDHQMLTDMVTYVNAIEVAEIDRLSNTVYYYDRERQVFEAAEK